MKTSIIFFIIGLLVTISAFFIGNADNLPFVLKTISPKYYNANNALQKLKSFDLIIPIDKGFNELEELFLDLLLEENDSKKISSVRVLKFKRENATLAFSKKNTKEKIPVKVFISNDQILDWNLEELSIMINNMKKQNLFIFSIIAFILGIIIQVIGFVLKPQKNLM